MKIGELLLRAVVALESIAESLKSQRSGSWYDLPVRPWEDPGVPSVPREPPVAVSYGCQPYPSTWTVGSPEWKP